MHKNQTLFTLRLLRLYGWLNKNNFHTQNRIAIYKLSKMKLSHGNFIVHIFGIISLNYVSFVPTRLEFPNAEMYFLNRRNY